MKVPSRLAPLPARPFAASQPSSRALIDLADHAGARASLGHIVDASSDRSFPPFMLLLSAANLLPRPSRHLDDDGHTSIYRLFAIGVAILGVGMTFGRKTCLAVICTRSPRKMHLDLAKGA